MYDNESNEQFDQDLDDQTLAVSIVGDKGVGYIYESEVSDDEDSSTEACKEINTLSNQLDELYLSDDSISSATKKTKKRRTMSVNSIYTDREEIDSEFEDEDFEKEGIATVERAMENNHDLDTALLELNTLRMSMNVTYHEVRIATITALLEKSLPLYCNSNIRSQGRCGEGFLISGGLLFKRQAFDEEEYIDLMNIIMEKL
nr:CIH_HP1_G0010470.mRNA.1.CDS.1 [Saccharomyces cerevisiae]